MTSTWVVVALFAALFAVGLAVMLGGVIVVVRALRAPTAPTPPRRELKTTAATPLPVAPLLPDALKTSETAAIDEWNDEVPTAVFRPSDYQDIEALMQDADKYVSKHKNEDD